MRARRALSLPHQVQAHAPHAHVVAIVLIQGRLRQMCGRRVVLDFSIQSLGRPASRHVLRVRQGKRIPFLVALKAALARPALLAPTLPLQATALARCVSLESIKTLQKQLHASSV